MPLRRLRAPPGSSLLTYLVAAETVVLVLLAVLVAGLLRSHAEILRRLPADGEGAAAGGEDSLPEIQIASPPERDEGALPATDIAGATLEGDAVQVALTAGPRTLVAFLSSGCATCQTFWDAMQPAVRQPLPGEARLIVVTKDSAYESPSKLRDLAAPDVPLLMSSEAWEQYSVPVAPYFVHIGDGEILGEGSASGWSQIVSLFRDAIFDADQAERRAPGGDGARSRRGAGDRLRSEDQVLASAGITSGHPSLYPGEGSDEEQEAR